jgi:hypothetical protein
MESFEESIQCCLVRSGRDKAEPDPEQKPEQEQEPAELKPYFCRTSGRDTIDRCSIRMLSPGKRCSLPACRSMSRR